MKIGILSGNRDQYHRWISDYVDPYDVSDYFDVSSVVDLFEKRGINVQRVEGWRDRRDLYEIYDYIAHDGGLNDILLDGRYLNEDTYIDVMSDDIMVPLGSYVKDQCVFFKGIDDEKIVGTLTWKNGYFEFYGDTKDSAEAFFDDISNIGESLIQDKYIKRTQTFSEYDTVQKEKEEQLDHLEELVRYSIEVFVEENNIKELKDSLSYTVDRLIYEASAVFSRLNELDDDNE